MKTCEDYQADVSALIDGELRGAELTDLVRHLSECRTCMKQFEQFQRLQEVVERELTWSQPPEEIWDGIASRTSTGRRVKFIPRRSTLTRAISIAAVFALFFLAGYGSRSYIHPILQRNEPIVLASQRGEMNDAEFLELTRELLTADPVYSQKMYQILNTLDVASWEGDVESIEQANYEQNGETFRF
jgi:anti-sigma factor RsiW